MMIICKAAGAGWVGQPVPAWGGGQPGRRGLFLFVFAFLISLHFFFICGCSKLRLICFRMFISFLLQVIVQLWKGGRLCQDSLAADLASAMASAESSINGSCPASPATSPNHTPASPPPLNHLSNSTSVGGEVPSSSPPPPPVRGNVPSTTQLVLSEKQKHKNKLKKHCNMM